MDDYGWPRCAKCGGPVETITSESRPDTGGLEVTAYCHGEKETVFVSSADLLAGIMFRVNGDAFASTRQLEGK